MNEDSNCPIDIKYTTQHNTRLIVFYVQLRHLHDTFLPFLRKWHKLSK